MANDLTTGKPMKLIIGLSRQFISDTFVGQNAGAGRMDRVIEGVKANIIITLVCSAVSMAAILIFGDGLVRLFVNDGSAEVIDKAKIYFYVVVGFYPALGLIFVFRNAIQGLGYGLLPMIGGIFELFARTLVVILLAQPFGFLGICFANPVAWISALIPLIPAYYYLIRKLNNTE